MGMVKRLKIIAKAVINDMTPEEYFANCDIDYVDALRNVMNTLGDAIRNTGYVRGIIPAIFVTIAITISSLILIPFIEYKLWRFRKKYPEELI